MNFRDRKKQRTEHFEKYVKGWKLRLCPACNGTGYYDSSNKWGKTPKCGGCNGTGKERYNSNL